jgi:hypothetical protein
MLNLTLLILHIYLWLIYLIIKEISSIIIELFKKDSLIKFNSIHFPIDFFYIHINNN